MSGSRLPGDSESNDRHSPGKERFETRIGGDLKRRAYDHLDQHHASKAELVRAALDDYLPDDPDRYAVPENPEVAKAYRALAGDSVRRMDVDKAVTILCRDAFPSTQRETLEQGVLRRHGKTPFCKVVWSEVVVCPLTPLEELPAANGGQTSG